MVCNTILRPALEPQERFVAQQQNNTQQNSTEEYDYTRPQPDYFAFNRRNQQNPVQFHTFPSNEHQHNSERSYTFPSNEHQQSSEHFYTFPSSEHSQNSEQFYTFPSNEHRQNSEQFYNSNEHQQNSEQSYTFPSNELQSYSHFPLSREVEEDEQHIEPQRRRSLVEMMGSFLEKIARNGGIGNTGW
jgi:anionic cell wall polymer biosynthesis LytR-Cps2A-Psr (LCP) family protein